MNKKTKTFLIILYISLFVVTLLTRFLGLWMTFVQRRINYLNEYLDKNNYFEFNYEDLLNFRTRFNNGHERFSVDIKGIAYQKYSDPFYLTIDMGNINENIIKFEIIKCNIIYPNGEIKNILETSHEKNISSHWVSNDGYRGRMGNSFNLTDKNEIIIEKSEDEHIDNYYIIFDMPINYKTDDELTINYEINIYLKNETKTYIFENHYKRVVEEKIILPPIKGDKVIGWYEITLDEYNKNIKKAKIRRLTAETLGKTPH